MHQMHTVVVHTYLNKLQACACCTLAYRLSFECCYAVHVLFMLIFATAAIVSGTSMTFAPPTLTSLH
jgi:hypothetical protein